MSKESSKESIKIMSLLLKLKKSRLELGVCQMSYSTPSSNKVVYAGHIVTM